MPDRQQCIHMVPVNPATGLPTPPQKPIHKPISLEWEPMDYTGNGIPDLNDISEEVIFLLCIILGLNYI